MAGIIDSAAFQWGREEKRAGHAVGQRLSQLAARRPIGAVSRLCLLFHALHQGSDERAPASGPPRRKGILILVETQILNQQVLLTSVSDCGFNGRCYFGRIRFYSRLKASDWISVPIKEELGEVPLNLSTELWIF